MSPSDAPTFSCMRCHWHSSGALLLLPSGGDMFDQNLDTCPNGQPLNHAAAIDAPQPSTSSLGCEVSFEGMGAAAPAADDAPGDGFAAFGSPMLNMAAGGAAQERPDSPPAHDAPDMIIEPPQPAELWFGADDPMDADDGAGPSSPPHVPPDGGADRGGDDGADDQAAVPDPYAEVDTFAPDPESIIKPHKTMVPKTPACAFTHLCMHTRRSLGRSGDVCCARMAAPVVHCVCEWGSVIKSYPLA